MAPRSGSANKKRIVELKNEIETLKHSQQANTRALEAARRKEVELTERRNELMDVKPELIPEPGHDKFAGLYPI
jgi:hypothetical protein